MSRLIPRFDYRDQYRAIRREVLEAIDRVLESGQLILGPTLQAFEQRMVQSLGTEGRGVGVACGTDALAIALRALGIGPGDEVITVSHTAVGTVSAVRMLGATPVFCDIDPRTHLMDPADAARRVTPRTRAIVPVHLYGNAVDMPAILDLARWHRLKVVEDCAQSCGTTLHGRATGTWGDIGCFSFYPTKNLGAYGDGGFCFTSNPDLALLMSEIRSYGCRAGQIAEREGVNSRLHEIQAAVLEVKMRYLPRHLRQRRAVAEAYCRGLGTAAVVPAVTAGAEHSYHLFVVEVERREQVISRLRDSGIECGIHYPTPVHRMPAYQFLGAAGTLPVTERTAGRVLSLPCYPELPMEDVERVCSVVNDALAG